MTELDRVRAEHAETMRRLKGQSGREVDAEVTESCARLRNAHRRQAILAIYGPKAFRQ